MNKKAYASLLKKEMQRRGWVFFAVSALQFVCLFTLAGLQMTLLGISPYLWVPISGCATLFASLGGAQILLYILGAYTALKPIEKDPLNPINYAIPLKENTRIAVLMPIYHEDVARVGGGLKAMMEEVANTSEAHHFDWFVLSDSRKEDIIVQESALVHHLRQMFPKFCIAYRHRVDNIFAKVGNTSDFYRRWGGDMIMLLCSMQTVFYLVSLLYNWQEQ